MDGDSLAAVSLGLLGQDRDASSVLRTEWTGLVLCHNSPGWGTKSMKWVSRPTRPELSMSTVRRGWVTMAGDSLLQGSKAPIY